MSDTVTITTKTISEQLNKWRLTNHGPVQTIEIETLDNGVKIFDKPTFELALKKTSRKISEPAPRKTKTLA